MKLHLPTPRLLPVTIAVLAGLLSVKTAGLVRLAVAPSAMAAPLAEPAASAAAVPPGAASPGAASPPAGAKPAEADRADKPAPHGQAAVPPVAPSPGATTAAAAAIAAAEVKPSEVSESERAILLDLRKRREDLEARERQYAGREAVIAAAERRLTERVAELQALQVKLESLEADRAQREEANWRGLVKLYETMKPRDAAAIFNDLDMHVLLPVLDRMKESKAAPVLAAMQPDKARLVTTGLAQLRLKQTTPPSGS